MADQDALGPAPGYWEFRSQDPAEDRYTGNQSTTPRPAAAQSRCPPWGAGPLRFPRGYRGGQAILEVVGVPGYGGMLTSVSPRPLSP